MSCSSYQSAGFTIQSLRSSSPRRYVLERGGRPKGMVGSDPRSTMRPRHPSWRSVTAAFPPASPVPTITTVCMSVAFIFIFIVKNPLMQETTGRAAWGNRSPMPLNVSRLGGSQHLLQGMMDGGKLLIPGTGLPVIERVFWREPGWQCHLDALCQAAHKWLIRFSELRELLFTCRAFLQRDARGRQVVSHPSPFVC